MKAPNFWKNKNITALFLLPLSFIYFIITLLNKFFSIQYKSKLKIICVGNINVGGAGKTPVAIEIGRILRQNEINFAYLSKGYGADIKKFTKVEKNNLAFGDEPLLLAEIADTFVCNNRKTALKELEKYNYDAIVMDDGFQNPTIFKDKNIVVINGEYGIGNGFLLPSGPCRETMNSAIKRADLFIIIGNDKKGFCNYLKTNNLKYSTATVKINNKSDKILKYIAFCGIGMPNKFFKTLEENNYNVIKKYEFDDHFKYNKNILEKMILTARDDKAKLITTKKDWIKLPNDFKKEIDYIDIQIIFDNVNDIKNVVLR
jgi:tetraacyldisaccharide 4'-kinase